MVSAVDDHDRVGSGHIDVLAVRAYGDVVNAAADRDRRNRGFRRRPLIGVGLGAGRAIRAIYLFTNPRLLRRGDAWWRH